MDKMLIKDLAERVHKQGSLVLYPSIYTLLGPDQTQTPRVFGEILTKTLQEFAMIHPVRITKTVWIDRYYTFVDNFAAYLNDQIDEKAIELIPTSVLWVRSEFSGFLNAGSWRYEAPELYAPSSNRVCYFSYYPMVLEYASDNQITEESAIYMMNIQDTNKFLDYLTYRTLVYIRDLSESVNLNLQISFLNSMNARISELHEIVANHKKTRSDITHYWRK